MSGAMMIRNRERILEAIDQLRRRKARPDIQRICNYLFRRFAISSSEARSDLQRCVDNDVVLRVEYKGSISYRNASKKFSHSKKSSAANADHHHHHQQQNGDSSNNSAAGNSEKANRKFAQLLTNAFGELVVQEPDYLNYGVPGEEIVNNILGKDSVRYTRKYITILLEKEVENGGLIRMEHDRYLMGPNNKEDNSSAAGVNINKYYRPVNGGFREMELKRGYAAPVTADSMFEHHQFIHNQQRQSQVMIQIKPKKKKLSKGFKETKPKSTASMNSDDKKADLTNKLRVGVRRKRAKKVFDPSDTHVPKKRGRPVGSLNKATLEKQITKMSDDSRPDSRGSSGGREQGGVCSVCHVQNKRGPNDRMVACRECSNKAHYSCLNGEDMMLRMYPDNTWQCPHCKTCVICFETSDAGFLVVCYVCADAYHAGCHQPHVSDKIKPNSKWLCINCEMPEELKINEIQSNMSNPFSRKSRLSPAISRSNSNMTNDSGSSGSSSGNSSPNYHSSPMSPTPPQLSPQNNPQRNSDGGNHSNWNSDSQSNRDFDNLDDYNIDPSIPDASNWTAEDVYQYFLQYFPEELANIFREQEIDGRSLLLLRRIDVLTNLNLKLGPALKIYRHVVKLQVRRDDRKLYWL